MYMSNCKSAEENGVAVLHGSRSTFRTKKQPAFRALFNAMSQVWVYTLNIYQFI